MLLLPVSGEAELYEDYAVLSQQQLNNYINDIDTLQSQSIILKTKLETERNQLEIQQKNWSYNKIS